MTAIKTKYVFGVGNKPNRVVAVSGNGNRISISADTDGFTFANRHRKAAEALCAKMNWKGTLIQGSLKDCEVFVFVD